MMGISMTNLEVHMIITLATWIFMFMQFTGIIIRKVVKK